MIHVIKRKNVTTLNTHICIFYSLNVRLEKENYVCDMAVATSDLFSAERHYHSLAGTKLYCPVAWEHDVPVRFAQRRCPKSAAATGVKRAICLAR